MREEIRNEAAVQDVEAFEQFMEATTFSNGEMINYSNIACYCDVDAKTVKSYYQILKNTLMGYEMSAYAKVINQKVVQLRCGTCKLSDGALSIPERIE